MTGSYLSDAIHNGSYLLEAIDNGIQQAWTSTSPVSID